MKEEHDSILISYETQRKECDSEICAAGIQMLIDCVPEDLECVTSKHKLALDIMVAGDKPYCDKALAARLKKFMDD